jgi:predicted O-methyltransferase YrrM
MSSYVRSAVRSVLPVRMRRSIRLVPHRWKMVRYYGGMRRSPVHSLRYLISDLEPDNFTYDIKNDRELAHALATMAGAEEAAVLAFINEIRSDRDLAAMIEATLRGRPDRNRTMPFGRRMGWYAVVRLRKPKLVYETGVHDGLGSIALLRALQRNRDEGAPGHLVGFDINPAAGWLIPDEMRGLYDLVIGDSLQRLPDSLSGRTVNMFVHDSDHSYEHEMAEWQIAKSHLGVGSILISDNAHACDAFQDFCAANGFQSMLWREVPRDHFYPGAGIGMAVVRADWQRSS